MNSLTEGKLTTTLPQLMTRKRQIPGKREFNTAKLIGDYYPATKTMTSAYRDTFSGKPQSHELPAGIGRKAYKSNIYFIRENPRFINEEIRVTNTSNASDEQCCEWWPKYVIPEKQIIPQYKRDTVTRQDFQRIANPPLRSSRFDCKPERHKTAISIIPVNEKDDFIGFKPTLSFEHQYDCRRGRIDRGKRVGTLVFNSIGNNVIRRVNTSGRHTLISLS